MKRVSSLLVVSLAALLILALVPAVVSAAGGAFVDDDDSIFETDIEWLAAAGVTLGCNPPVNDRFCPGTNVNRGQMAAFMRRFAQFLGAEDGQVASADHADNTDNATNATNASTVGGLLPGDIIRANGTMSDTPIDDFTAATWTDIQTMQIEAPVDGVLVVMGSVGLEDDSSLAGDAWIALRLTIDGVPVHSDLYGYTIELSGDSGDEPFATVGALNATVAVGQGQHAIAIQAMEIGAGTYITARSVSAVFSAFGGGIAAIPVGEPAASHNN
jgi:hypothetical protein